MKTILYKITKGMRTIVASLVIVLALTGISIGENSITASGKISDDTLALQVKSWVNNSAYWVDSNAQQIEEPTPEGTVSSVNTVTETENQELSRQMESWISNSAYWNDESDSKEQELAHRMKSWISTGTYWSGETLNKEQGLASQIRSWMNNSEFWCESNDYLNFNSELASN